MELLEILLRKKKSLLNDIEYQTKIKEESALMNAWDIVKITRETISFNKRMVFVIDKSIKEAGYVDSEIMDYMEQINLKQ